MKKIQISLLFIVTAQITLFSFVLIIPTSCLYLDHSSSPTKICITHIYRVLNCTILFIVAIEIITSFLCTHALSEYLFFE